MNIKNQPSHERLEKLHGAYIAFIAAGIIALISGDGHIATAGWAICLWTLSLPWLVTVLLLDYVVRKQQERSRSATRGAATGIGYLLSNTGTTALIISFSYVAAALYIISIVICAFCFQEVAGLGWYKEFEDL